ncbi:hypothetical protein BLNAU_4936 [Blattamonas nauphoetae]|uniref:Uncharacterized protein n=1 Tax=Blattamonas nauphoetae TaxID=2049346 RepID=A0ABQ9Y8N7_9EUKA|nr:hypothetical protein BLNAU_4936 [Blattamonas nauphoetae]
MPRVATYLNVDLECRIINDFLTAKSRRATTICRGRPLLMLIAEWAFTATTQLSRIVAHFLPNEQHPMPSNGLKNQALKLKGFFILTDPTAPIDTVMKSPTSHYLIHTNMRIQSTYRHAILRLVYFLSCRFLRCSSEGISNPFGGAVDISSIDCDISLDSCVFMDCKAANGGGFGMGSVRRLKFGM